MSLPCHEIETGSTPAWCVLWLHGLGADGHDFAPIVPELVDPAWPALRFVFPHAPVRAVTVNGGLPMRAWYDIHGFDLTSREDEAGIRASCTAVGDLIEREAARGIPAERVVLAGFSQGGAIALAAGLSAPCRLAGIIALSTYLPLAEATLAARSPANVATPCFLAHGHYDPVVPLPFGLLARDRLRLAGQPVEWHEYAMGHAVVEDEIADLRQWFDARLAG